MLTAEERDGLVSELASRPGHEKVRALLHRILVGGLGADSRDIDFEKPAPEVRGRIDALLGRTVFELKSDLRRERREAEDGLTRYLSERQSQTGENYVGIATDGAEFVVFSLRGGRIAEIGAHRTDPEATRASLAWLQGAVALGDDLLPDPHTVEREFGRGSLAARRALEGLADLWGRIGRTTEARLKRELWGRLLGLAYGAEVGDDALFLQHTYLAIVARAVAWAALIDEPPGDAAALLHGAAFSDLGVGGQSEPDFFDWVLAAGDGRELVMRAARQVRRFRLRDIRVDILKALYESLIDPETRHDLGEYYTPDWLAARMVAAAVDDPLTQRVMDPACGSGTFLFHAMRTVLAAAGASGLSPAAAARLAARNVAGIDIHPVAVIFARVTCLLALLPALRKERPGDIALPVWLGDALQWNLTRTGGNGEQPDFLAGDEALEIFVPAVSLSDPAPRRFPAATLRFPAAVASDTGLFDRVLDAMIDPGARQETVSGFAAWLGANTPVSAEDLKVLRRTWETMRRLRGEGRDHIWGYVARNLARPVWLASEAQRADVVIGNPPWVSFRYMSEGFQERFREECRAAQLWVGGNVSTHQDLSGYFYLRVAALYMRPTGRVALVMPYAAMSRLAYAKFREGPVARAGCVESRLRFTAAWTFGPEVSPLFPVPACVLFAAFHDGREPAPLPARVAAFAGALPTRNADAAQADASLVREETAWPALASDRGGSPYRRRFRQGATLVPRRLVLVEDAPVSGKIPPSPAFPRVRGRMSNLDKAPWKAVEPPRGAVEAAFLRPVLLGESIAPFRVLAPLRAVVPWDGEREELLDSERAAARGHRRLARWLERTEELWEQNKRSAMSLKERVDYHGELSCQFPIAPIRVVYTTSGTNLAAATVRNETAAVDSKLYWAAAESLDEANYLCGVLNSAAVQAGVARYQSQGQWGARDFGKYVFNLPIPRYDAGDALHRRLADAAATAAEAAGRVPERKGEYFTRARKRVRNALAEHGVAARLEKLAVELLGGA